MYIKDIYSILPQDMANELKQLGADKEKICELRVRTGKRMNVSSGTEEILLDKICTSEHIEEILDKASNYSLFAYEDEIKNGFLTTYGGIRIGICGNVNMNDLGQIRCFKNITSINIRIPKEIPDASKKALKYVYDKNILLNTVIVSPPGCGKTTFLRDLIKKVSDGNSMAKGMNVGLIDERYEVAALNGEGFVYDMGDRCDVIMGACKCSALMMLIRSMRPDVIAVDEIDPKIEFGELNYAVTCGISLIATIHGFGMEDMVKKGVTDVFDRYIFLDRLFPDNLKCILNNRGEVLYARN